TPDDWAVLNADDSAALAMARMTRARRMLFSLRGDLSDGIVLDGDTIVRRAGAEREPLVPLSSIRLIGQHLVADVLAASAVAWLDMFRDYAERGYAFKQEVLRLQEEWSVTREQ